VQLLPPPVGERDDAAAPVRGVHRPLDEAAPLQLVEGGRGVAGVQAHRARELARGAGVGEGGEHRHVAQGQPALGQPVVERVLAQPTHPGQQVDREIEQRGRVHPPRSSGVSLDGLGFLVGELTGREEVSATPWAEGGPATARATGEWALDGGLLVQHHVQERDGAAVFGTLNVFTTDPATGDVLLYAFDSVGYPPEPAARGTWHGEEQVLERTTERGSART